MAENLDHTYVLSCTELGSPLSFSFSISSGLSYEPLSYKSINGVSASVYYFSISPIEWSDGSLFFIVGVS